MGKIKIFFFFILVVFLPEQGSCLICGVSHIPHVLHMLTDDDTAFVPENCKASENVKKLFDKLGKSSQYWQEYVTFNCFTLSAQIRRFNKTVKYLGCMPPGSCFLIKWAFGMIRDQGDRLLDNLQCFQCEYNKCNIPGYARAENKTKTPTTKKPKSLATKVQISGVLLFGLTLQAVVFF